MNELIKSQERFGAIPFNFVLVANATQSISYTLSTGWDFATAIFNASSTGSFTMNLRDEFTQENLFYANVNNTLITGTGQNPFILPTMHKFLAGRTITVSVTDTSGAGNTIQVVLIGNKEGKVITLPSTAPTIKSSQGIAKSEKYTTEVVNQYQVDRLMAIPFNFAFTGVAGAIYVSQYPISTGYSFMWDLVNSSYNIGGLRDFSLQIKDEYVTEEFFTSPVNSSLITGNGQFPFILPRPYVFEAGTTITMTTTDTAGGAAISQQVALIGYKVKRVS
jgi:hypothetical protein